VHTSTHLLLFVQLCRRDEFQKLQELALRALEQQIAGHYAAGQARARDSRQAQALVRDFRGVVLETE
jgi:hypothetical protein